MSTELRPAREVCFGDGEQFSFFPAFLLEIDYDAAKTICRERKQTIASLKSTVEYEMIKETMKLFREADNVELESMWIGIILDKENTFTSLSPRNFKFDQDEQSGVEFISSVKTGEYPWVLTEPNNNEGSEECVQFINSDNLTYGLIDVQCGAMPEVGFVCRGRCLQEDSELPVLFVCLGIIAFFVLVGAIFLHESRMLSRVNKAIDALGTTGQRSSPTLSSIGLLKIDTSSTFPKTMDLLTPSTPVMNEEEHTL